MDDFDDGRGRHILRELGFTLARVGDELHGHAQVRPEMWAPGTRHLRTSVLAAWTDHTTGLLAVDVLAPRVPVTLELDVHLYQPAPAGGTIHAVGRALKAGRSVVVLTVDFTDGDGLPVAVGTASFMAAPDPRLVMPADMAQLAAKLPPVEPLRVPLAERAGCERREPGTVVLPRSDDGLNSSGTVNGGLVALAVEEAALSLSPGATLSSLAMRYLRPVRLGPAVATATVHAGLAQVEVHDEGADHRLATVATARTFTA